MQAELPGLYVYTVSELTRQIKETIEGTFPPVWVEGEISDYVHHGTSGHRYFTLKDGESRIKCVMWRWLADRLRFVPKDGLWVLAYGELTVYERGGRYQLMVSHLHPAGVGELWRALEQLKEKLAEEGLFSEERKRPLPPFPERIGVVTSADGAAIWDIVRVVSRRAPWVEVVLYPVRVQGEGAAEEVAFGIERMNAYGEVDLLIVGRGGGSTEDLWAFNEEVVVRAVARSHIPVISAVGHEVDVTLTDLAADRRAPTPSAAAEMAVPDRAELADRVRSLKARLRDALEGLIGDAEGKVAALRDAYSLRQVPDRILQYGQEVDELRRRLGKALEYVVDGKSRGLLSLRGRLEALSPGAAMERGFSVVRRLPDGRVVRDAGELKPGDRVEVQFSRGRVVCEVLSTG